VLAVEGRSRSPDRRRSACLRTQTRRSDRHT
jgi:hypothetical protein